MGLGGGVPIAQIPLIGVGVGRGVGGAVKESLEHGALAASADSRKLLAVRGFDDARAADFGLHYHMPQPLWCDLSDYGGVASQRMLPHDGEELSGLVERAKGDELSFVRDVERVEAQQVARGPDLGPDGYSGGVKADADFGGVSDFVECCCGPASGRIA